MTGAEKDILNQIAGDVTDIKVTLGRVETRVQGLGDTSLDHEGRLRSLEKTYISRTSFLPIVTVMVLVGGEILTYLHK